MELEAHATALLHRAQAPFVPLVYLHRALSAESGPGLGAPADLRARLARRPDLFLVLERPSPLVGAEGWTAAERAEYEAALGDAGYGAGPMVASVAPRGEEEEGGGGLARSVGAALAQLAAAAGEDPALGAALAEAAGQADALLAALGGLTTAG